ncbi:MAG: rhodanese-like domain-containing protein [Rhodobacteraceae bacterium]|nr:rhodanese-like domain-containing protein [Paracoccaceae bacterium]
MPPEPRPAPPRRITRRALLTGTASAAALGGAGAYILLLAPGAGGAPDGVGALSVAEAHSAARAGDILLIDIRRPDEWARTGVGAGARPLDMRRDDFIAALDRLAEGDRTRPVALICARGVRSARLAAALRAAGFERIVDVPEGMSGSRAGPGWLAAGLPVARP